MLFVGNLTYAPNVDAVRVLVDGVLPALRERMPEATLDVVGGYDDRLIDVARRPGVRLTGHVPDLAPYYAGADVVVVPLRVGSGTRIKVLEAFAYQRPVVATRTAVSGLAVRDGVSVLLAETPGELAACTVEVLRGSARARGLVAEASRVVREHYVLDVVAPVVRRIVLGAGG